MYKLVFFVPEDYMESVKQAVFDAGAGRIGQYDQCSWQTKGQGQFRPLAGSQPVLGTQDQLEVLDEWQVEMVCENACISAVVAALKLAHPYEEVAYQVWQLAEL